MKLFDIIEKIEESQIVIVSDSANDELARYDGKNSIPAGFLLNSVLSIYAYIENGAAVIRIQIYDN